MPRRIHPHVPLPPDAPARMVAGFTEMKTLLPKHHHKYLDKLIEKWSPGSWHADTLEWLCNDAGGHGVRCQNWADLYKRVVLI